MRRISLVMTKMSKNSHALEKSPKKAKAYLKSYMDLCSSTATWSMRLGSGFSNAILFLNFQIMFIAWHWSSGLECIHHSQGDAFQVTPCSCDDCVSQMEEVHRTLLVWCASRWNMKAFSERITSWTPSAPRQSYHTALVQLKITMSFIRDLCRTRNRCPPFSLWSF